MAITDRDIVKITVNQEYLGANMINVFWYLIDVTLVGLQLIDIMTEFRDEVWDIVRILQHANCESVNLVGENVTNGIDVDTLPLTDPGLDTGSGGSGTSFDAAGFRLNVGDRTTRPGGKRVGGIGEARVADNVYQPELATADDVANAFELRLEVAGVVVGEGFAEPIIVGRDEFGDLELSRHTGIVSVDVLTKIRSQVSRRI